jgi:hypothetical protein
MIKKIFSAILHMINRKKPLNNQDSEIFCQ